MSAIRIARTALRVAPSSIRPAIQRRGYADVASDKIQLSLTLPHQVRSTEDHVRLHDLLTSLCVVYLQIHRCVGLFLNDIICCAALQPHPLIHPPNRPTPEEGRGY